MCRGGRMCKGTTRRRASHTPSRFFFRRQGSVHLACCPVFVSSFPSAGSPSPDVDEAACFPHTVSFSLFFGRRGGVHLARRLVFFLSARRPSWEIYEAACIPHAASLSFFFSLMGVEPAPILVRFPPKGGILFFFRGCIVNGGGV